MNFVGRELEVVVSRSEDNSDDDDVMTAVEAHPPLSPASGAEALFMSGLKTSNISANALAAELHRRSPSLLRGGASRRSSSMSIGTTCTDDFVSTYSNLDDLLLSETNRDLFSKDVLGLTREPIYEENMSNTNQDVNPEVASHVYEGVKGVWGWGKEQMVISTFLGMAEGIAGKVVGVMGTDLEEIDGNIKPQLTKVDKDILNPAISAIVGILMKVAGKSENILKPIIVSILKPVGLIKADQKDSVAPELTNSRVAVN